MKPSTAKAKGRDTENRFVTYLARWPDCETWEAAR